MFPNFKSAEEMKLWFAHQERMRNRFEKLVPEIRNADDLIPTSEIELLQNGDWRLKRDVDVAVLPDWRVGDVAALLVSRTDLWKLASLRLMHGRSVVHRAPVFGVPFSRAVEDALRTKISKAVFFLTPSPEQENFLTAHLFARITRLKQSNGPCLGFEAWEWIGEGHEVNYAHMILSHDAKVAKHIDGAKIEFSDEVEIQTVFSTAEKRKGVNYAKYFRLDGDIALHDAIELAQRFFVVKELSGEYFECQPFWPEGL